MLTERLEGRRLFSASPLAARPAQPEPGPIVAVQSGGMLTLSNVNSVQIVDDGSGGITVYDKSLPGSDPAFETTYAGITHLTVTGTRGDDNVSAALFNVNTTIDAGRGDDFITASVGGSRADSPKGASNVVINGGLGNDRFAGNNFGTGSFAFNGGGGRDALSVLGEVGYQVHFKQ